MSCLEEDKCDIEQVNKKYFVYVCLLPTFSQLNWFKEASFIFYICLLFEEISHNEIIEYDIS